MPNGFSNCCSPHMCKHLHKGEPTFRWEDYPTDGEPPWCRAFPGGIPDEIAHGNNPHTEPYPGDHGIQFEKEEKAE